MFFKFIKILNIGAKNTTTPTNINVGFQKEQGFMLVEMLVSVALFSVVMTVSIGSLLSIVSANRKSQSFKIVVNNLNLAVETMSRDIRVGMDYNCGFSSGGDCPSGADSIYFISKTGSNYVYRYFNNSIQKSVDGSTFVSVTAPDIVISTLTFYVLGSDLGDQKQPKVVIIVKGHSKGKIKERVDFGLQTTVSQRLIDS